MCVAGAATSSSAGAMRGRAGYRRRHPPGQQALPCAAASLPCPPARSPGAAPSRRPEPALPRPAAARSLTATTPAGPLELPLPQHLQPAHRRALRRQRDRHQGERGGGEPLEPHGARLERRGWQAAPPVPSAAPTRARAGRVPAALCTPLPVRLTPRRAAPRPATPQPGLRRCRSTPPGAPATTSASSTRRWRRRARPPTSCRRAPAAVGRVRRRDGSRGGGGARAACCAPTLHARLPCPPARPQIVTGYGEAGHALVTSPDVGKLIFVGSTQIGRKV